MSFIDKVEEWFENLFRHPTEDYATVTVRKGDSLWHIAEDITGDGENWHQIANLNADKNFGSDYTLQPGEVLKIPKAWTE